jgi:hypothetical protein
MAITGSGTSGDPYIYNTFSDLEQIGTSPYTMDKYHKLGANIDASATQAPSYNSGQGWSPRSKLTGNFNGNNKTISGLYINRSTTDSVGLFADSGGTISNLIVKNCSITGQDYVGAISGVVSSSCTFTSCHIVSGNISGRDVIGGLIGGSSADNAGISRNVNNCSFLMSEVRGRNNIGGILGYSAANCYLSFCIATGIVRSTGDASGGLVGSFSSGLFGSTQRFTISNSYSKASVVGNTTVGGLIGYKTKCVLSYSYSMGVVNGLSCGGLNQNAGSWGGCTDCFWDKETSLQPSSACGTGKTTSEMKTQSTFTNWDFTNNWEINSHYPTVKVNKPSQLFTAIKISPNESFGVSIIGTPGLTAFPSDAFQNNAFQMLIAYTLIMDKIPSTEDIKQLNVVHRLLIDKIPSGESIPILKILEIILIQTAILTEDFPIPPRINEWDREIDPPVASENISADESSVHISVYPVTYPTDNTSTFLSPSLITDTFMDMEVGVYQTTSLDPTLQTSSINDANIGVSSLIFPLPSYTGMESDQADPPVLEVTVTTSTPDINYGIIEDLEVGSIQISSPILEVIEGEGDIISGEIGVEMSEFYSPDIIFEVNVQLPTCSEINSGISPSVTAESSITIQAETGEIKEEMLEASIFGLMISEVGAPVMIVSLSSLPSTITSQTVTHFVSANITTLMESPIVQEWGVIVSTVTPLENASMRSPNIKISLEGNKELDIDTFQTSFLVAPSPTIGKKKKGFPIREPIIDPFWEVFIEFLRMRYLY